MAAGTFTRLRLQARARERENECAPAATPAFAGMLVRPRELHARLALRELEPRRCSWQVRDFGSFYYNDPNV